MASFTKRNNKWRAQVVDATGKRRSMSFTTRGGAERWAREMEVQRDADRETIRAGEKVYDRYRTLREMLERYSEEVLPEKKGERRERLVLQALMRKFPDLADMPLTSVTTNDLLVWRNQRMTQVSVGTVIREIGILSHAFTTARRAWGWVKENPMTDLPRPKSAAPRNRRPTHDEIERLKVAGGYDPALPPTKATTRTVVAFLFCCETALRCGELCALTWDDVDTKARTIHVAPSKNGLPRTAVLTTEAVRLIEQLRPVTEPTGKVLDMAASSVDALFRKLRKRADIDTGDTEADLHFHDSRREALTRLSAIYQVQELAKISGHLDIRILVNTYYAPKPADLAAKLIEAEGKS